MPELEHDERLIASVAKKVRVHELAKELGLTNKEALDLCIALGIDAKSHSSSIEDAQGDRVRRRAERDGLVRAEQPAEPAPAKRTTKKAAAAAKVDAPETGGGVAVAVEEPPAPAAPPAEAVARVVEPAPVEPVVEVPAPAREEVVEAPAVVEVAPVAPAAEPEIVAPLPPAASAAPPAVAAPVPAPDAPAPAPTVGERPTDEHDGEHRIISSRQAVEPEQRPLPPERPVARRPESGPSSGTGLRGSAAFCPLGVQTSTFCLIHAIIMRCRLPKRLTSRTTVCEISRMGLFLC